MSALTCNLRTGRALKASLGARRSPSLYGGLLCTSTTGVRRCSSTGEGLGGRPRAEFIAIAEMASPFVRDVLRLKFVSGSKGHLLMTFDARDSFIGHPKTKVLHGGVVAAALDHVAGFCAWTTLTDQKTMISTLDLRVDYLKPCPFEAELQVVGRVISMMKRTIRRRSPMQPLMQL